MEVQKGDQNIEAFSFENEPKNFEQVDCYLTYTNEETHKIIRENLHLYLTGALICVAAAIFATNRYLRSDYDDLFN